MQSPKYDQIGVNYNVTRKADPFLTDQFYQLLAPQSHGTYLDIGCGTGNYTVALQNRGINLIGIDPSEEMLGKARKRNPNGVWQKGQAEAIDLENESIDGIFGSLTLHHWSNLSKGFSELNRILKSDGNLLFFTATPVQMRGYWLNHYFPKMLEDSILQMPKLELLKNNMEQNKIEITQTVKYFIQDDLQDLFLYAGKNRPSLYFNPNIRRGISSFSALSNKSEVEQGLQRLKMDVDSGEINEVIEKYRNTEGDYLFIAAKKIG